MDGSFILSASGSSFCFVLFFQLDTGRINLEERISSEKMPILIVP